MSVSNHAAANVSTRETSAPITRTNIVLLAILLVQLAASAYLLWPRDRTATSGEPLLSNITIDNVTAFTITDNNGRAVSFAKEGDAWTLADTDGYPARADKVSQTLTDLVGIATDRLVTQTAGSHDRLQVAEDNYQRKVDLTTADGVQTLYLGSSSGASSTHVRAANSDATYLTSNIATWELDTLTSTWIDVAYFSVPKEQIIEVTLENENGTLTFIPTTNEDGTSAWTLADATTDEPVASATISTFIDRVANLNLHSVLGKSASPDYGLDAPLATLTVTAAETTTDTTAAPTTTTLVVGAKDEENDAYYFKSSDSEYYVRLAAFTGDEFVNSQRSDFYVQSDETTEGAAPEATDPAVDATTVTTDATELDNGAVTTATVEASGVTTETVTPDDEATPAATVEAGEVTTDTTTPEESEEDDTVDAETEDTVSEEAEPNATPSE